MATISDMLETTLTMLHDAAEHRLIYRQAEDAILNGRLIELAGRPTINFGSCSYLGLETDERLKQGVIEAVTRYGTQFSSSRTYLSAPLYGTLEAHLEEMFGGSTLVCPSTTLGHMAALPTLISERDAIILDQQVHHSVQVAANQVRLQGTHVELIRHNRLDQLEERLIALRGKHRHIWYLADGVYSMYATFAPIEALEALMARYECLHLYMDDSHAVGWTGRHGRGHTLERLQRRDRVVVAASLNKSFASAGAALIFPDQGMRDRVRMVGGPMIFAGPVQPPMLGAALASAKLHLSDELATLQGELHERIRHFNLCARQLGLPVVTPSEAPIRFIGTGLPKVAYKLGERLLDDGFYTNLAIFPAVAMRKAGTRLTLTRHQTLADIEALCDSIARHLPQVLSEEGSSLEALYETFELGTPPSVVPSGPSLARPGASLELTVKAAPAPLRLERHRTIATLDRNEWDQLLGANGSFTWEGLRFLEATFRDQASPECRWDFHYYLVRDEHARPVLATFFTAALWKDDMLAPARVSTLVEAKRQTDPYFLTSRVFAMGSLLTEGTHLYLDRRADWKQALGLLLEAAEQERAATGANMLVVRDWPADDPEIDAFMREAGLTAMPMPKSFGLDIGWQGEDAYLRALSHKHRYEQRHKVLPFNDRYTVEVRTSGAEFASDAESAHLYQLYRNVHGRNLTMNVFPLPEDLFAKMVRHPGWEIVLLRLRERPHDLPVGMLAAHVGPVQYAPMLVGLDYRYVESDGLYRQLLRQMVRRAEAHGKPKLLLGMGADMEKRMLGARSLARKAYVRIEDPYHQELLVQYLAESAQSV